MKHLIIIFIFFSSISFAQANNPLVIEVEQKYQSFQYQIVISLTQKYLSESPQLFSDEEKISLYLMQAVSFYSLSNENKARESIIEILKINREFEPNSTTTSPKIINFFNKIKLQFNQIVDSQIPENSEDNYTELTPINQNIENLDVLRQALFKSTLLPGLGHFQLGNDEMGWTLTTASVISLSGLIYYALNSTQKESDYLNETNPLLISQKYDEFNSAYKIRNLFIISYVAIWVYSQADLIFYEYDDFLINNSKSEISFIPVKNGIGLNLTLKF